MRTHRTVITLLALGLLLSLSVVLTSAAMPQAGSVNHERAAI